jgi:magnesium transporter
MPTVADLMTASVPRSFPTDTVGSVLSSLHTTRPAEAGHVYLIDHESKLIGQVPVERLLTSGDEVRLADLRGDPPIEVCPEDNAESVALMAVERHDADVAVVDGQRKLLGAIPIGQLLSLLHEEHVDDILRMVGVAAIHPIPTEPANTLMAVRARIPWLTIGLAGGFFAGGVAALFEASLQREIALAFFLPLVVYMADAVGTQTETVLVRALAYGRVSLWTQIRTEGTIGLLLGIVIGAAATGVLLFWDGRPSVALVIGLTLVVTAVVATLVASLLPLGLARFGADPALASGPIATVLQDILSVALYLGIATAILR